MISYIASLFAGIGLWTAIGVTLVAGLMRGFAFSNAFIELLSIKIALLSAMYILLTGSFRAERQLAATDLSQVHRAARRLIIFNLAIVGLGAAALLMGLWLLGA